MAIQRFLAAGVATLLAIGISPALAQQASGSIAGKATDEAKQPYNEYSVRLRDVNTGQIAETVELDAQGQFSFGDLQLSRPLLVELTTGDRVVCTEGPYVLTPDATSETDVNVRCGRVPAAIWLLAAGAGAAAGVAVAVTGDAADETPGGTTGTTITTVSASN